MEQCKIYVITHLQGIYLIYKPDQIYHEAKGVITNLFPV